jgi:hypothetical protein
VPRLIEIGLLVLDKIWFSLVWPLPTPGDHDVTGTILNLHLSESFYINMTYHGSVVV